MARAMGAALTGVDLLFLQPLFCAPYNHQLQRCINTEPLHNVLSRVCCGSTNKQYDKIWDCDVTRQLDIVTELKRSLAIFR